MEIFLLFPTSHQCQELPTVLAQQFLALRFEIQGKATINTPKQI